mgnify:CR=1 FL=1
MERKQGVIKGTALSLTGKFGGGLFLLLFHMFAARILPKGEYGLFQVFLSLVFGSVVCLTSGIADTMRSLIASTEAVRGNVKKLVKDAVRFLGSWLGVVLLVTGILFRFILNRFFDGNLTLLILYYLSVSGMCFLFLTLAVYSGLREFHMHMFGNLIYHFLFFLLFLIFVHPMGVDGCALSLFLSTIITLAIFGYLLRGRLPGEGEERKIWIPALLMMFANLFDIFLLRGGPVFIKILGGSEGNVLAGRFGVVYSLQNFLRSGFIALYTALLPNLSAAERLGEKEKVKRYVFKSYGIALTIIILNIFVFYLAGERIVKVMYGWDVGRYEIVLITSFMSFYIMGRLVNRFFLASSLYGPLILSSASGAAAFLLFLLSPIPMPWRAEGGLAAGGFVYFVISSLTYFIRKGKMIRYEEAAERTETNG